MTLELQLKCTIKLILHEFSKTSKIFKKSLVFKSSKFPVSTRSLPSQVDWSKSRFASPVKDQGIEL